MTARNEKPSDFESSTDIIIDALELAAMLLEDCDTTGLGAQIVREAAQRLDKLENELILLRKELKK